MNDSAFEVFPGGSDFAYKLYDRRRSRVRGVGHFGLPDAKQDLAPAKMQKVTPARNFKYSFFDTERGGSDLLDSLSEKFSNLLEIELLHANCISHLRRRPSLPLAKTLFHRIWNEHCEFLLDRLPPRWLISAMTTFGDHGSNASQRILGNAFNMFFGMLKLYEFERRLSNPSLDYGRFRPGDEMPLGLARFGLKRGDLDLNLIGRLHELCSLDETAGIIGRTLLLHLNEDDDTVFARLIRVKDPDFMNLK